MENCYLPSERETTPVGGIFFPGKFLLIKGNLKGEQFLSGLCFKERLCSQGAKNLLPGGKFSWEQILCFKSIPLERR